MLPLHDRAGARCLCRVTQLEWLDPDTGKGRLPSAGGHQSAARHRQRRGVSNALDSIKGPVALVGHSYGGSVIPEASRDHANVNALVYVSALPARFGRWVGR